jgi:hypothetical protein
LSQSATAFDAEQAHLIRQNARDMCQQRLKIDPLATGENWTPWSGFRRFCGRGSCGRELVGVLVCGVQGVAEDVSSVPGAGQVCGGAGDDLVGVVVVGSEAGFTR